VAVRVKGLRQVQGALRKVDKGTLKTLRDGLKEAAEPVRQTTIGKLGRFQGVSTNVRTHVLGKGVFVRQNARKVTGLRGDFGGLQYRKAFVPALEEHEDDIPERVEDAFDQLIRSSGW